MIKIENINKILEKRLECTIEESLYDEIEKICK